MKKATRKEILNQAWACARAAAGKFGGSPKNYIAEAMAQAWADAKAVEANCFQPRQVSLIASVAATCEQEAMSIASAMAAKLSYETPQEMGFIRNKMAEMNAEKPIKNIILKAISAQIDAVYAAKKEQEKEKQKAERKAKAAQRPKFASIKKICESIQKACVSFPLSETESKFVSDIKNKRKLTERQAKWLKDIAAKKSVAIQGEINIKSRTFSSFRKCEHEGLGSLGYTHGTTVKCPHCGQMAVVW